MPASKRVRLTINQKIELLNKKATGSIVQNDLGKWAMNRFGLSEPLAQQTVSNILKSADKLYGAINTVSNSKSLKTGRFPQLDEEVRNYVANKNENNLAVNRETILRFVKHQAFDKYKIPKTEISFTQGWLSRVFKRIGLKRKAIKGENMFIYVEEEVNDIEEEVNEIEEDEVNEIKEEAEEEELRERGENGIRKREEEKGKKKVDKKERQIEETSTFDDPTSLGDVERTKLLIKAYETILIHETPLCDHHWKFHRHIRSKLIEGRAFLKDFKE